MPDLPACRAAVRIILACDLPLDEAEVEELRSHRDALGARCAHLDDRLYRLTTARRLAAPRTPRHDRLTRLARQADEMACAAECAFNRVDCRILLAERELEAAANRRGWAEHFEARSDYYAGAL